MSKPKILVTGATGGTGLQVVQELLAKGLPVRAMVHRRDERSAELEKRGVEIVEACLYDPDQLLDALRGVQRAYYLPLMEPFMIQSAAAFAVAAQEAKLEHVVQMSHWTSHRAHPTAMTQQTWLVDKLFAAIPGVAQTTIDPVKIDRATVLVKTGVYQFTRNPMYLSMALLLTAWATYLAHPLAAIVPIAFVLYINRFQITPEERALQAKFGDLYKTYRSEVRRWI